MFWQDYFVFMAVMAGCFLLSAIASAKVRSSFAQYDKVPTRSGLSGYDTAARLLRANFIRDIGIGCVPGVLTDHYHPTRKIVNLSESTYHSRSVAAVAVAAHELGHVMQKEKGYLFYRIRTAIVPVVNIGSRLAMPLVLVGILLNMFLYVNSSVGFYVAMIGVILYAGAFVFALVTLPVELNASRRAKEMLLAQGILTQDEIPGAKKVLSAAAMTYLVSLLTSFVYFLRFLLYVLAVFGRRGNRR